MPEYCPECITNCFPFLQNHENQNIPETATQQSVGTPNISNEHVLLSPSENELDAEVPSDYLSGTPLNHMPPNQSPLLMGIEIETSAIKLKADSFVSFRIITTMDKHWQLETDTSDMTFRNTESEQYNRNLELKTINGHTKDDIILISKGMEVVLNYLKENSSTSNGLRVDKRCLKQIGIIDEVRPITKGNTIYIKAKDSDNTIRPQITYQLPLHLVPKIFERLNELGHQKIPSFLECTDPFFNLPFNPRFDLESALKEMIVISNEEYSNREDVIAMRKRNIERERCIKSIFYAKVRPVMGELNESTNVKGFCYLVTPQVAKKDLSKFC